MIQQQISKNKTEKTPASASCGVYAVQLKDNREYSVIQRQEKTIQRLVGAAHPIAGHDEVLPGVAVSRNAAALNIANYINLRARQTGPGVHAASSDLGANNGGNLYVQKNYTTVGGAAASLETWSEMTDAGGGYVKRVKIIENGAIVMDRVMNELLPSALNVALHTHAAIGAVGAVGTRHYGSVHGVQGDDAATLNIGGATEQNADNITKIVGEGARFGWLAQGLSDGTIGNKSKNIFKTTIKVPQIGSFKMDPTFEDLWGAWRSAFGRKYMRDKEEAKNILRLRMVEGWRRAQQGDAEGAAPLESGGTAGGQVTSLTKNGTVKAIFRPAGESNGATIVSALKMTFTSPD